MLIHCIPLSVYFSPCLAVRKLCEFNQILYKTTEQNQRLSTAFSCYFQPFTVMPLLFSSLSNSPLLSITSKSSAPPIKPPLTKTLGTVRPPCNQFRK